MDPTEDMVDVFEAQMHGGEVVHGASLGAPRQDDNTGFLGNDNVGLLGDDNADLTVIGGRTKGWVLFLLAVVFVFNQADRQLTSVLLPSGMRCDPSGNASGADLVGEGADCITMDSTQQGLLLGPVFTAVLMGAGLPISWLTDHAGSRTAILVAGLVFWSLVVVATTFVQTFWQLILCRMLLAVGEASNNPAAYSLLSEYFTPAGRARAFSVYHLGVYLGGGLSYMSGAIAHHIGWRYTNLVWGCPGLLVAAIVAFAVKEPPRHADSAKTEPKLSTGQVLKHMMLCPPFVWLTIAAAVRHFGGFALVTWIGTFYGQGGKFDLNANYFGPVIGLMIVFGGGVSQILGGYIADRVRKSSTARKAYVMAAASLLALPLSVGIFMAETFQGSLVCLYFTLFFGESWLGTSAATIQDIVPPQMRARASAVYIMVNGLVGGFGPLVIGALVQTADMEHGESVAAAMLQVVPACYGGGALFFSIVGLSLKRHESARHSLPEDDVHASPSRPGNQSQEAVVQASALKEKPLGDSPAAKASTQVISGNSEV